MHFVLSLSLFFFTHRNDNRVMRPLWRLQNGQGPSWKYAQAKVDLRGEFEVGTQTGEEMKNVLV